MFSLINTVMENAVITAVYLSAYLVLIKIVCDGVSQERIITLQEASSSSGLYPSLFTACDPFAVC